MNKEIYGNNSKSVITNHNFSEECLNICFSDVFMEWQSQKQYEVKQSSFNLYESIISSQLNPFWGNITVHSINFSLLQEFIDVLIKQNLSLTYIKYNIGLLKRVVDFYNTEYKMNVIFPKYRIPQFEYTHTIPVFQYGDWFRLVQYVHQHEDTFSKGLLLAMLTGIRIGELSGLRWEDFDSNRRTFIIRRTIYRSKNPNYINSSNVCKTIVFISTPKTNSSIRELPIPNEFLPYYNINSYQIKNYVLTNSEMYMEPRVIQNKYKHLLETLNIPYLKFHSLRHSFATYALQRGVDYKTISELLGHTNVSTTLNIYMHSSIEQKRKCVDTLWTE